ncbi:uncharacterized protein LOC115426385 [Sphaeramia orbicularis]|uniref:uncharacterized protein LOC115426385 n=1 Tax=Sphaeramia orbicularis TaxID=375764 RepID=UPI00117F966B|nr:uncharacterized protein LOC115426385 [Sphaeramia orbicularis]
MTGLWWKTTLLVFFLSSGNTWAAVDQTWLTSVAQAIKNEYAPDDTFSLAVNIPENQDPNDLQPIFQDDPVDKVRESVSQGQVYQGTRVVAAGTLSSVFDNIQHLKQSSWGNVLVIYSEQSPCGPQCSSTNQDGITAKINDVIQNWSSYAFVFSKALDNSAADIPQAAESFKNLQISQLGLDNVFRCYKPDDAPFQCTSCNLDGNVTPSCVANVAPSNPEMNGNDVANTGQLSQTGSGKYAAGGAVITRGSKVREGRKQRKGKNGVRQSKAKRGRKGKGRKGRKGKGRGKGRKGRKGKRRGKGRKGKNKTWGKRKRGGKRKKWGKRRGLDF